MKDLFGKLTALFEAPDTKVADGRDPVAVAMAALMVRLARADGDFDDDERAQVAAALDERFGDGAALLAAGEAAEENAIDHQQFTRLVKSAYEPEERGALLEDLWAVVLSDGERDDGENALMRQFGSLLHVSDQEVAKARRRVERG